MLIITTLWSRLDLMAVLLQCGGWGWGWGWGGGGGAGTQGRSGRGAGGEVRNFCRNRRPRVPAPPYLLVGYFTCP